MNYHSKEWIMSNLNDHYLESLDHFTPEQILGLFYQGSGNYGLDTEKSDVDTKLVVLPTLEDVALNKKPVSTTHIRENQEHIDFKDVRLMLQTFRKQNINFLEILFTDFKIVNPIYEAQWNRLVEAREAIAHYNRYAAVKSTVGVAKEKYFAMEHRYESKADIIDKYGYDPKQLHHLVRCEEFLKRYIRGEGYEKCLISTQGDYLKFLKLNFLPIDEARAIANKSFEVVEAINKDFSKFHEWNKCDPKVEVLLNSVQLNCIKTYLKSTLS